MLGIVVGFILILIAAGMSNYYYGDYYYQEIRTLYGGVGFWSLICGIIVIVAAVKLNSYPMEHTKWGVFILVFSIIGLGPLLGLIGGILALVYKPQTSAPQRPTAWTEQIGPQVIARICPQCGRVLSEEIKFCPYCGKELG